MSERWGNHEKHEAHEILRDECFFEGKLGDQSNSPYFWNWGEPVRIQETGMPEIIYPEESYKIMGACFEVYREKGCGFLEPVFQECMELELGDQGIAFEPHPRLPLTYKGRLLRQTYTPDLICFGKIVLELKAVSGLVDEHRAQVHNYLRATGHRLGLLVNFGHYPNIQSERIVL